MGWFDEQIRERKRRDEEAFDTAFSDMASAVLGSGVRIELGGTHRDAHLAADEIIKFFHIVPGTLPQDVKTPEERLEYLLRPHGIMYRKVVLKKNWHKTGVTPFLTTRKSDGVTVALLPSNAGGYICIDPTGRRVRVRQRDESAFGPQATSFYAPFPMRPIGMKDLLRFMISTLTWWDFGCFAAALLAVTLLGLLVTRVNYIIFGQVIESSSFRLLYTAAIFLSFVSLSRIFFDNLRDLMLGRLKMRAKNAVEAATMMRILSLPPAFFTDYGSGELTSYVEQLNTLCQNLSSALLSAGLTSLFSIVYIGQILHYAPALVLPSVCVLLADVVFSVITAAVSIPVNVMQMKLDAKENALTYALITGVQKIRLAGAERRAFARWARKHSDAAAYAYNPIWFFKLNSAIAAVGTLALYAAAIRSGVSVAEYYAFNTAYAMVAGAFSSISSIALSAASIQPILTVAAPLLRAQPEVTENRTVVTRLSGGVEMDRVSFRYAPDMPNVVENLSLKIRPGQYVAIVGKTGCGKSTLMRLLLGFETPQKGAIYYDGQDITSLELRSLRARLGVVMQDEKLFQGDIYSNIAISAPGLSMEDAWTAAETAGIADDIRAMPMGMFTMLSEGGGGISGGQRQRLLIARAIAPKPRILMFDEATSALDNVTQKQVSEALDALRCTRIVIAHRLSTIRHCDRILVLDGGRIAEDGTYDQLIAARGLFADLVERQRLEQKNGPEPA